MVENNSEKYLSLKTAAQLYGYTRDHLGLMIRQGKLRGLKLGSYYVTKAVWMTEYLKKYADRNHPAYKNKLSNKFLAEAFLSKNISSSKSENEIKPEIEKKFIAKSKTASKKAALTAAKLVSESAETILQTEISEELLRFNAVSGKKDTYPDYKFQDAPFVERDSLPYMILPVRKMSDFERSTVLKKIPNNNYKEDPAKTT